MLTYVYLPPGGAFDHRYLVMSPIQLTAGASSVTQPPLNELARYTNSSGVRWSTTGPAIGYSGNWNLDKSLGYVMTSADPSAPSNKIEECESGWAGHPDFLLTNDGMCVSGGFTRLRTAGWVYTNKQPNTEPLYRCYSGASTSYHFASNDPNCEGMGTMEWLLGYTVVQ